MTLQLPRFQQGAQLVDDNGYPTTTFHIWWDRVASNLEATFNDLQTQVTGLAAAVQRLNDMDNDNILTPVEKPVWITLNTQIVNEQSDIDSKATTFGITTEKTNYDNACSTLATYLATLTTPVAWNNLTGNTTITGTTFRSDFNDVLAKKQLLLSAIDAKAKTLADSAQTTANTGVTNAATAQSTADTVTKQDAIAASWTSPGTILSATDAGSNATITVANHTRKYNDVTSVSVTGGNLTALAYSTKYYIYYDDPSLAGGSVTLHSTTDPNNALPGGALGRHFCGSITTPASGGGGTSGGVNPGGGGGGVVGGEIP